MPKLETTTLRAASSGKRDDALRARAVEHHVLVDLVADARATSVGAQQLGEAGACSAAVQTVPLGLCGVLMMIARVRGVERRGDARRSRAAKVPGVSGTWTARAAGQRDVRAVAVVAGLEHDHLVARVHERQDRREDAPASRRR